MSGIAGFHGDAAANVAPLVIRDGVEERHGGFRVLHGEDRIDRLFVGMVSIDEARIAFEDMRRIPQHGFTKVNGGRRRVDGPVEAVSHQQRKSAAVVNVGMRQHHRIDGPGGEGKGSISPFRFFAAALKHAAVEQNPLSIGL